MVELSENYYFSNKPGWLLDLYKKIDEYCLDIKQGVEKEFRKTYIKWSYSGVMFCRVFVFGDNLKLYLKLKYDEMEKAPDFIRDYSKIVRGVPTIEILLNEEFLENQEAYFAVVSFLIRKAFSETIGAKKLKPVRGIVEPVERKEIRPFSINLSVDGNGDIEMNLKLKKSQREILNKILETILK